MTAHSLLLLPGDGIGPEVMAEVERIVGFFAKKGKAASKRPTGGVDSGALRKAKSKSKGRMQDARDARVFRSLQGKRGKAASRASRWARTWRR